MRWNRLRGTMTSAIWKVIDVPCQTIVGADSYRPTGILHRGKAWFGSSPAVSAAITLQPLWVESGCSRCGPATAAWGGRLPLAVPMNKRLLVAVGHPKPAVPVSANFGHTNSIARITAPWRISATSRVETHGRSPSFPNVRSAGALCTLGNLRCDLTYGSVPGGEDGIGECGHGLGPLDGRALMGRSSVAPIWRWAAVASASSARK